MNFLFHLIIITCTTLIHALGYNIVFGKGKIFHFGPLGTSIGSAYATFVVLQSTQSYLLAMTTGLAAALALSCLFAWLSFRLDPDGLGIMTIAMHLVLITIVLNWASVTRGALGLPQIPRMPFLQTQQSFAITILAVTILWGILLTCIDRSRFGRQLSALSEQEWYAKSLGINRMKVHLVAFLLAGVGAFLTNLFFHQYIHLVHPSDFSYAAFIFYIMIIVAGKPGSILGVTCSTVLLVLLKEGLRFVPIPSTILGPTRLVLFGMILLGAVWIRRDTLFPKKRTI